jgi:hypothetical protein
MDKRTITLTERIVFAEDWLDRARRQLQQGEVAGGALAMLLAEAELCRARETGLRVPTVPPQTGARSWRSWAGFAALACGGILLAFVLAAVSPPQPGGLAQPVAPALRLAPGTGELLRMVTVPEPAIERTIVRSRVIRIPVPPPAPGPRGATPASAASAPATPASAAAPPLPERRSPPVAPAPAPQAASAVIPVLATPPAPAAAVLSEAEVIDMVLAAERSLRRAGNQ